MTKEELPPTYPYVKFKMIKKICTHADPNGVDTPENWYLRVEGVHNSPSKLTNYLKSKKHILVGHGNLNGAKYNDVRNYVDSYLGVGTDTRLRAEIPPKPLKDKVENAKQAGKTSAA